MFEHLTPAPPDSILGITEAFQRDPRKEKINLSVGVYQDAAGRTPVLETVKKAERWLLENEGSKTYLGIDGLPEYRDQVRRLVFRGCIPDPRVAVVQTPGGTAGVRVASDVISLASPEATVWYSNPTWANHPAIFEASGLRTETYPYLNAARTGLDFAAMLETLRTKTRPRDVVLLHACCHNPTGIDPAPQQWSEIAQVLQDRQLLPLVDFAYQGFGQGIEEDTHGLKTILAHCPEALVATSFSKNFGLYSERVGSVAIVGVDGPQTTVGLSQLKRLVRVNYSNPPRHGAAIVAAVLADPDLTASWEQEVRAMRGRIAQMRQQFVEQMRQRRPDVDFSFLLHQQGMFSYSGLNPMQVDRLKNEHAIYIVGSGRINVAGMTPRNIDRLCEAVASVLAESAA